MHKVRYDAEANLIVRAIDIAIHCFMEFPPENFEDKHTQQFIDTYTDYRNKIISPEPRFHNLTSLKHAKSDILTYFQEASGVTVDVFWKEIKEQKLSISRVDRFKRILKAGKIKNHIEYDIIIDLYNPYIETNMLTGEEIEKINDLISKFERKK